MQSCHALNCKLCVQISLTYQIIIHMLLMSKRKFLSKNYGLSFGRYSFNETKSPKPPLCREVSCFMNLLTNNNQQLKKFFKMKLLTSLNKKIR